MPELENIAYFIQIYFIKCDIKWLLVSSRKFLETMHTVHKIKGTSKLTCCNYFL